MLNQQNKRRLKGTRRETLIKMKNKFKPYDDTNERVRTGKRDGGTKSLGYGTKLLSCYLCGDI